MSSPSNWKLDDFAGDLPEVHGLLAGHEDKWVSVILRWGCLCKLTMPLQIATRQKDPVPASKRYLDGDVFSNELFVVNYTLIVPFY